MPQLSWGIFFVVILRIFNIFTRYLKKHGISLVFLPTFTFGRINGRYCEHISWKWICFYTKLITRYWFTRRVGKWNKQSWGICTMFGQCIYIQKILKIQTTTSGKSLANDSHNFRKYYRSHIRNSSNRRTAYKSNRLLNGVYARRRFVKTKKMAHRNCRS